MKRFICVFLFLFSISNILVATELQMNVQHAQFYYPDLGNYTEVYLSVNAQQLVFNKNVDNVYNATLLVKISLFKQDSLVEIKNYLLHSINLSDIAQRNFNIIDLQRFSTSSGNYTYTVSISDSSNTNLVADIKRSFEVQNKSNAVFLSDILLLSSYEPCETGLFCKHGRYLIPELTSFYDTDKNSMVFLIEGYNTSKSLGKDASILWKYRIEKIDETRKPVVSAASKKDKAWPICAWLLPIDITKLSSGTYDLVITMHDSTNKILGDKHYSFRRYKSMQPDTTQRTMQGNPFTVFTQVDSLKQYIRSCFPIANGVQRQNAEPIIKQHDSLIMQNYLFNFWKTKAAYDPFSAFMQYQSQVYTVNKTFGTRIKKGYETDRGRIYLKYGPPNTMIDKVNGGNIKPYQIWHYYTLDSQRDRKFVFVDDDLIVNDYTLMYSNAAGESVNFQWDTMKKDPTVNSIEYDLKNPR